MPYLEVQTPSGIQRASLDRPRLTVGRLPANDIVIPHQQISRFHAELSCADGVWWIADLDSTNGLRTQDQQVERRMLVPGERVYLTPGIFLVLVPSAMPGDIGVLPTTHMSSLRPHAGEATASASREPSPPPAPAAPRASPGRPAVHPARVRPRIEREAGDEPRERDRAVWPRPIRASIAHGDPFLRARGSQTDTPAQADASKRAATTYGPSATMLHQCQTCGQRTAPGLETCQHCQSPITTPCTVCHTSLLPVQDLCPRCLTPNSASVLRARPG